jgi:hypothetical protein
MNNSFCFISFALLFVGVVCDVFQVRTIQLAHSLSMEDHLTGADPDPGCAITMRLSWLSQNATACIFKENDSTGVVPFVSDVISVELGDAPLNPSLIVWLDCFENDCGSGCVFDESCKIGITGLLNQEDDVRERANATFPFVANRTDTIEFKLQLYSVRFELVWIPASYTGVVTPVITAPVTAPVAPTTTRAPPADANGGKSEITGGDSSTEPSAPPGSNTIAIAVGVGVAAVLLLALIGALVVCKRRSRGGAVSLNAIEVKEQSAQQQAPPYVGFNPIPVGVERSPTLQEWESDAARIGIAKAKAAAAAGASAPTMSTIGKYDSVPEVDDE